MSWEIYSDLLLRFSERVKLDNGNTIVVKKLKDVTLSEREFEQQLETFGSIRHENVAAPMAYYFSRDMLMIYDYQNQGSVSALLHGMQNVFNFCTT